jgi:ketosteroid isomerase-like protein
MARTQDFDDFMKRREAAAVAYVRGDPGPVVDLTVRNDPASFFGPDGSKTEGIEAVLRDYRTGASYFGPESACHFEVLHKQASDDEAFWTGFQVATVQMKRGGKKVPVKLRVTEVFRKEDGEWRLAHRHADQAREH